MVKSNQTAQLLEKMNLVLLASIKRAIALAGAHLREGRYPWADPSELSADFL